MQQKLVKMYVVEIRMLQFVFNVGATFTNGNEHMGIHNKALSLLSPNTIWLIWQYRIDIAVYATAFIHALF